jgi:hypothetical protein
MVWVGRPPLPATTPLRPEPEPEPEPERERELVMLLALVMRRVLVMLLALVVVLVVFWRFRCCVVGVRRRRRCWVLWLSCGCVGCGWIGVCCWVVGVLSG